MSNTVAADRSSVVECTAQIQRRDSGRGDGTDGLAFRAAKVNLECNILVEGGNDLYEVDLEALIEEEPGDILDLGHLWSNSDDDADQSHHHQHGHGAVEPEMHHISSFDQWLIQRSTRRFQ